MTNIPEGDLTFSFKDGCQASKYDDWSFYRKQFQAVAGESKAVDILCIKGNTSWLIEIKDYRQHPRTNPIDIAIPRMKSLSTTPVKQTPPAPAIPAACRG